MKSVTFGTIFLVALLGVTSTATPAQDINVPPRTVFPSNVQSLLNWEAPFAFKVKENGWKRGGRQYSDAAIIATVAQMLSDEWGVSLGQSTRDLLRQIREDQQLADSGWMKSSPRITPGNKEAPETLVLITAGGYNSGSNRTRAEVRIGKARVGGSVEHGDAGAYISLEFVNLNNSRTPIVLTGKHSYGSTNLESVKVGGGFGRSFFGFDQRRSSSANARGHVAVEGATNALWATLRQYRTNIR